MEFWIATLLCQADIRNPLRYLLDSFKNEDETAALEVSSSFFLLCIALLGLLNQFLLSNLFNSFLLFVGYPHFCS